MIVNDARLVPAWMQSRPYDRLGVVLRPCEMRALIEMANRAGLDFHRLLTICVDCLGTYPAGDYQWRAARKGSPAALEGEALQFARQGGIVAYRYRSACQACSAPQAQGADLNIGVIGLSVRQHILLEARDEATASRIHLDRLSDGELEPALVAQRERTLAKMAERRRHTQDRLLLSLADILPASVEGLISQFESCADCQNCMAVCPICEVDFPKRGEDRRYLREDIVRWLASCAGCGMCEQACPNHLPLVTIFRHVRQHLVDPLGHSPGC
jgi:formate dehydrogenase subunit beta